MKAAVFYKYGSPEVLKIEDIAKPQPGENEILIKVHATAVNSGDVRIRKADPFGVRLFFGLLKPKYRTLGSVYSGVVERTGAGVKSFKVGDAVYGHTNMRFGAYAEYISVKEDSTVTLKPVTLSHQQAASVPFGALTALHFMRKAEIQPGQKVLIVGASGAVGSAAVQLAKAQGAIVTGVCSTNNVSPVKEIGADSVIDYNKSDFTKSAECYDVVMDTVNKESVSRCKQVLKPNGTLILSAAGMKEMFQGMRVSMSGGRKFIAGVTAHNKSNLQYISQLIEEGKYKSVVDRIYTLDAIAEAHAYTEQGHKRGNVVIDVALTS
ncbi:MAG: NAD(P)-dependent alcohol dehydrogenase [Bacteroidia bacterium]|nr:NAD(P)-dependent alcohol dehydrogenase [Bacteroidia bacterium]